MKTDQHLARHVKVAFTTVLFSICFVVSNPAAANENKFPVEVTRALHAPGKVVLYSLEPWEQPAVTDEQLHHFKVLGHTDLGQNHAKTAIREFQAAVSRWDGIIAMCFDPRQAIRVTAGDRTYDFLLCYSCHQLYVYQGDKLVVSLGAAGSSKVLNDLLSAAEVPLSKTDSNEDKAIRRKKGEASEARWLKAMPKSLHPLRGPASQVEFAPDIKPLRAALAKEFPDVRQRILALFEWYGSGDGPWSGYPAYESVAEDLLFDNPTSDLISAAQTDDLTETQLEGAARLFGGWEFFHRRPDDRKTLPASLKKKLLDHSLKSTIDDNLARAKTAFGQ